MNRIYFANQSHPMASRMLPSLRAFYATYGETLTAGEERRRSLRDEYDHVLVWNGRHDAWSELRGVADLCVEVGWLPQADTVFANRFGTTGLARWPDFDPAVPPDFAAWKADYLARHQTRIVSGNQPARGRDPAPTPPYILVIGQLHLDTSMIGASVTFMPDLLRLVRAVTDAPLVWRPHPGEPDGAQYGLAIRNCRVVANSPLYPTIQGAHCVIACSSTVLIEAALCGVRAIALGDNVWSDCPWPFTIPRARSRDELAGLLAETWTGWTQWRPDGLCAFLRGRQVDLNHPVYDPAQWRPWA